MSSPQREHPHRQQPHVLGTPSTLACQVCGQYALSQTHPSETGPEPDRLFCLVCGAHCLLTDPELW